MRFLVILMPNYCSKSRHNHKPLIFHGDYTQRLTAWREFRDRLETDDTALQLTLQLYQQCPLTHTKTNFFDRSTWPQAWNLIEKNDYNTNGGRKKKHHDKSYYRLAREEEDEYEFDTYDKKGNRTT